MSFALTHNWIDIRRGRGVSMSLLFTTIMFYNKKSYFACKKKINNWSASLLTVLSIFVLIKLSQKISIFHQDFIKIMNLTNGRDCTSVVNCPTRLAFSYFQYFSVMIWNLWKLTILLVHYIYFSFVFLLYEGSVCDKIQYLKWIICINLRFNFNTYQ